MVVVVVVHVRSSYIVFVDKKNHWKKKKKEKGELDRLGFSRAHTYKTRILR